MSILEVDRPGAKTLILGPALAGTLITPAEFDQAEEADGNFAYELIHGVLVVVPPPLECDGPDVCVGENEGYTTPLLPGFELSVGRLLQVADRWSQSKEQP